MKSIAHAARYCALPFDPTFVEKSKSTASLGENITSFMNRILSKCMPVKPDVSGSMALLRTSERYSIRFIRRSLGRICIEGKCSRSICPETIDELPV